MFEGQRVTEGKDSNIIVIGVTRVFECEIEQLFILKFLYLS